MGRKSSDQVFIKLKKGSILYRRFHKGRALPLSKMERRPTWFAHELGYGSDEFYGPIIRNYEVHHSPKLLNLDSKYARQRIANKLGVSMLDPDDIYSGGQANMVFHKRVCQAFPNINGTYIRHPDDEEWEGAEEIVLWPPKGKTMTHFLKQV